LQLRDTLCGQRSLLPRGKPGRQASSARKSAHETRVCVVQPINLNDALDRFTEYWSPKMVARINDYEARIAKVQGEFVWHEHADTDEFFLTLRGELTIELADRESVVLRPGDVFVVPKGVRHRPRATHETAILLFEPSSVVNTGDAGGELTAVVGDLTES
jgi:mannose-6-phosphate isomerase-like protein (cupin superfamily)